MRFFLPWSARWFYGDFVFIIDPFIWMVLGGAAFLLTSRTRKQVGVWIALALIPTYIVVVAAANNRMMTGQIPRVLWIAALIGLVTLYRWEIARRYGAKIALAALVAVTIYCSALATIHGVALRHAKSQAAGIANANTEHVLRVAAMPNMANPIDWLCVMETDRATYRFDVSLFGQQSDSSDFVRYEKPAGAEAVLVTEAMQDQRAKIFLGFARFPVIKVVGEDCVSQTLVQLADLRYTEPGKGRGTFSLDVPVECPALEKPR
jgi:inner membrane protein